MASTGDKLLWHDLPARALTFLEKLEACLHKGELPLSDKLKPTALKELESLKEHFRSKGGDLSDTTTAWPADWFNARWKEVFPRQRHWYVHAPDEEVVYTNDAKEAHHAGSLQAVFEMSHRFGLHEVRDIVVDRPDPLMEFLFVRQAHLKSLKKTYQSFTKEMEKRLDRQTNWRSTRPRPSLSPGQAYQVGDAGTIKMLTSLFESLEEEAFGEGTDPLLASAATFSLVDPMLGPCWLGMQHLRVIRTQAAK